MATRPHTLALALTVATLGCNAEPPQTGAILPSVLSIENTVCDDRTPRVALNEMCKLMPWIELDCLGTFHHAVDSRLRTTPPLLAEDDAREVRAVIETRFREGLRVENWVGEVIWITRVDHQGVPMHPARAARAPAATAYLVRLTIPSTSGFCLGLEGICLFPLIEETRIPGFPRTPLEVGDWARFSASKTRAAVVDWIDTRESEVLLVGPVEITRIARVHSQPRSPK